MITIYNQSVTKYCKIKYIQSNTEAFMYGNKIYANTQLQITAKQGSYFILSNVALDPNSTQALLYAKICGRQILISQLDRQTGRLLSTNLNLQFSVGISAKLIAKNGDIHIIGNYKSYQKQKGIQNLQKANVMEEELPIATSEQNIQKQVNTESISLRRSTRTRVPSKTVQKTSENSLKKKKDSSLRSMAAYFNLKDKDLSDGDEESDEDEVFNQNQLNRQQSSSQSSNDSNCQQEPAQPNMGSTDKAYLNETVVDENYSQTRKRRKPDQQNEQSSVITHAILKQSPDVTANTFSKPTKNPYL